MSVVPQPWPLPVPQVAEAVAAMYGGKRERPLPVLVRDKLGEWLSDEQFAGAYGVRGKPGWPPARLALVTIFQLAEDLTDRQAAEHVRTRIDWKYALGLDLTDPGFDHSVLSEFRTRVAGGGLDRVVLDTLLQRLAAGGLVGAGGKMRTDSTHVISAVRDLNRLELAGESVRACLEQLAVAAPQVVAHLLDDWWGRPVCGQDRHLADACLRGEESPSWHWPTGAMGTRCSKRCTPRPAVILTWPSWRGCIRSRCCGWSRVRRTTSPSQTADAGREVIKRREADAEVSRRADPVSPPRMTSMPAGAWNRDTFWNGYKVHVTETCDTSGNGSTGADGDADGDAVAAPQLITNVETTDATVPDNQMTEPIHARLAGRGLLPAEHYVDSGYPSAQLLVSSLAGFGISLVTPMLADTSPQARAGAGYDRTAFAIDFDAQQATCPQGHASSHWNPVSQRGTNTIVITFAASTCSPCPVRTRCTTSASRRRQLTVHPRDVHQAQLTARTAQGTKDFQARYALRAGVEGTIRQAVAVTGIRKGPLPRVGQDPPRTCPRRGRGQPDPAARLVERPPAGPDPHQPPRPPRTRPGSMTTVATGVQVVHVCSAIRWEGVCAAPVFVLAAPARPVGQGEPFSSGPDDRLQRRRRCTGTPAREPDRRSTRSASTTAGSAARSWPGSTHISMS